MQRWNRSTPDLVYIYYIAKKKQPTQRLPRKQKKKKKNKRHRGRETLWPVSHVSDTQWYTREPFFSRPYDYTSSNRNFIREIQRVSSWGCITWNVRSLLSRSHCTPLMGRVWYGDNMTHLRVIVEPDGTLCSRGPIMSATGAVLS